MKLGGQSTGALQYEEVLCIMGWEKEYYAAYDNKTHLPPLSVYLHKVLFIDNAA